MSERYTKLFSLPENLYAEGAPAIVSAGNLLKDNQTGKVLVQLKIRNISAKPIKGATVLIHPQDVAGAPMAGLAQQKYLDFTAKTGEEFGQKTAVHLPDSSARGFSVELTQAVFSDNSTWEGTSSAWEPLPAPESLSQKLGDAELVRQYRLRFGGKCEAAPAEHRDLWLCACGAWNRGEKCCCCGKEKAAQLSLDLDALKADRDARLEKEESEREAKEAADKAAAEASAKKTKKLLAILIPAAVICIAAVLILTRVVIPNSKYNEALDLYDSGRYDDAAAAFDALGGYKDSADRADAARAESKYQEALTCLAREDYVSAISLFKELGDYQDSRTLLTEAENGKQYQDALRELENGNYEKARGLFTSLGDYRDAQEYASRFYLRMAEKVFQSDSDDRTTTTKYIYDWDGKLKEEKTTMVMLDHGLQRKVDDGGKTGKIYEYDKDRNLTKTTEHKWATLTYSPPSFYLSDVTYSDNVTVYQDGLPAHTEHIQNGKVPWTADYDYTLFPGGEIKTEEIITYYSSSTISQMTTFNEKGWKIAYEYKDYSNDDLTLKKEYSILYEYDEYGILIRETKTENDDVSTKSYTVSYRFDGNGQPAVATILYADGENVGLLYSVVTFENGKILREQYYSTKNDQQLIREYTYTYEWGYAP